MDGNFRECSRECRRNGREEEEAREGRACRPARALALFNVHRIAVAAMCATALVVGVAMLVSDEGAGFVGWRSKGSSRASEDVSLLQERLSIGLNIAKAFEQTRERSEEAEGGQIKVHPADEAENVPRGNAHGSTLAAEVGNSLPTIEADRHKVEEQTEDSESWSGRKVRDMVARLFRAVAAMDERMTRNQRHIRRRFQRLAATDTGDQHAVVTRIQAAAKELSSVLHGEKSTRSIIQQQERVDDKEQLATDTKVQTYRQQTDARMAAFEKVIHQLKEELYAERKDVKALQEQKEEKKAHNSRETARAEADDDDVAATLSSLLVGTGVQPQLDAWCSQHASCAALSKEQIRGEKFYARLSRGDPRDTSLKWRCYASQTPTSDQSDPSPRVEAYCTHNLEIEEELSGAMKALEKQNQSDQLRHNQSDLRHQHALLLAQTSLADEKGVKSELGVVAADLNALEVASTKLKGKVELQEDGEREGVHAIATLARQITKVQEDVKTYKEQVSKQFKDEEHQGLVDSEATIAQIAPKIKKVYAVEQKDVKGLQSRQDTLQAALENKAHDLESLISKEVKSFEKPKNVDLRFSLNSDGQIIPDGAVSTADTDSQAAVSTPDTNSQAPVTNSLATNRQAAQPPSKFAPAERPRDRLADAFKHLARKHAREQVGATAAEAAHIANAATNNAATVKFATVWREDRPKSRTMTLKQTKTSAANAAVAGASKNPKGCLIHLSGVVKGLDADNSIEC